MELLHLILKVGIHSPVWSIQVVLIVGKNVISYTCTPCTGENDPMGSSMKKMTIEEIRSRGIFSARKSSGGLNKNQLIAVNNVKMDFWVYFCHDFQSIFNYFVQKNYISGNPQP